MNSHSKAFYYLSLFVVLEIYGALVSAGDTLTLGEYISDNSDQTLISAGGKFELGFFTPIGSKKEDRYIGIWYTEYPYTVVWVANRDNPVPDKTGNLTIDEDGELKLMGGYFSTQVGVSPTSRELKLLDTGNLILTADQFKKWQSFEYPTDTFLPDMEMSENFNLTSWKTSTNPGSGDFTFQQDPDSPNRYCIFKTTTTTTYWRSGVASRSFSPNNMLETDLNWFLSSNKTELRNVTLIPGFPVIRDFYKTRVVMSYSGEIMYFTSNGLRMSEPKDRCSVEKFCGRFGSCSTSTGINCKCLPGYKPMSKEEWNSRDYSSGCTRVSDKCTKNESFIEWKVIKVVNSDLPFYDAKSEETCVEKCRENCKCVAYAYVNRNNENNNRNNRQQRKISTTGCWFWNTDLIYLQQGYGNTAHSLYIKEWVPHIGGDNPEQPTMAQEQPTMAQETQHKGTSFLSTKRIILMVVFIVVALFCIVGYIIFRRRASKVKESMPENLGRQQYDRERQTVEWIGKDQLTENDKNVIDVPLFDLEIILVATNYFSDENKLGQGGFGPVYKGKFPGGQVMAVKRLSSLSGQGLQEFKNEVILIAKLQHRNLVRVLGYCVEGEEKILLYEYMMNKSLDAFIFDKTLSTSLDWATRFDIIFGIARGLQYLHHDSRLKIIHRDLKTSNILLDEEMNPKISDFGLAKIVEGKETTANTNRIVGSYGYMSPEYALDGEFSIKSDVFSFGVVVLEIISGKKNTGFYKSEFALNLLGYAWGFWKEDNALALVDTTLAQSCNKSEILKCINVGLLCVQEDPSDRPTISNVIFMIGGETKTLPNPKQPAFVARKYISSTPTSSSSKMESQPSNNVTFSAQEGR